MRSGGPDELTGVGRRRRAPDGAPRWRALGITAAELAAATGGEVAPYSPYGVLLPRVGGDGELDAMREGRARVQDEGSQLVALALAAPTSTGPTPGGGSTSAPGRAARRRCWAGSRPLDGACRRRCRDGRAPGRARPAGPSSGCRSPCMRPTAGRRGCRPELRPRAGRRAVHRAGGAAAPAGGALAAAPRGRGRARVLQRELLAAALGHVRPGGVVAYVTCSPHLSETVGWSPDVVRRADVEQLDARALLPAVPQLGEGPAVQLWPHRHGTDAMFLALLQRR